MKHLAIFIVAVSVLSQTGALKILGTFGSDHMSPETAFEESGVEPLVEEYTKTRTITDPIPTEKIPKGEKLGTNDCCQKCGEKFGAEPQLVYKFTNKYYSRNPMCQCYKPIKQLKSRNGYGRAPTYIGVCGDVTLSGKLGGKANFDRKTVQELTVREIKSSFRRENIQQRKKRGAKPQDYNCCQKCEEKFAKELDGVSPVYEMTLSSYFAICYCKKPKADTILTVPKPNPRKSRWARQGTQGFAGFCDATTQVGDPCVKVGLYSFDDDVDVKEVTDNWNPCGKSCQVIKASCWEDCAKQCKELGEDGCQTWVFSGEYCVAYSKPQDDLNTYKNLKGFFTGDRTCPM